jgi:hypothetical protein
MCIKARMWRAYTPLDSRFTWLMPDNFWPIFRPLVLAVSANSTKGRIASARDGLSFGRFAKFQFRT